MRRLHSRLDDEFMARALRLARRGEGVTSPNPCVGAVLVHMGRIVGKGWHRAAGQPHAEVEAIQAARKAGREVRGGILYVTLEPCSTWSRTPPCTDIILAHGLRRVVVGATDPNPVHRGAGFRRLQKTGVEVTAGVLREECLELNRAWNYWIVHKTPWVIAKCAMSLDGKIATRAGESRWITGKAAREAAHRLRNRVDAILVGVETVLKDDPALTIRLPKPSVRQPIRVVLDTHARTPPEARILGDAPRREVSSLPKRMRGRTAREMAGPKGEAWVIVGRRAPLARIRRLEARGARVWPVGTVDGRVSVKVVLRLLGKLGVTALLVEGGGEVLGSFAQHKAIHEVAFFVAPVIIGGIESVRAVAGEGVRRWMDSIKLVGTRVGRVGSDLIVRGRVDR